MSLIGRWENPDNDPYVEQTLVALDRLLEAIEAASERRDLGWLPPWGPREHYAPGAVQALREAHTALQAMTGPDFDPVAVVTVDGILREAIERYGGQ